MNPTLIQPSQGRLPSLRLTCQYEGRKVQLISQERVKVMSPPSEILQEYKGQSGFWYEVMDSEEHVLYRRASQNPIQFDAEIFTDDPEMPIVRRKIDDPHGQFSLLVPDMPEATTLVLFSSPPEPEFAYEPAQEFARFALHRGDDKERQS